LKQDKIKLTGRCPRQLKNEKWSHSCARFSSRLVNKFYSDPTWQSWGFIVVSH